MAKPQIAAGNNRPKSDLNYFQLSKGKITMKAEYSENDPDLKWYKKPNSDEKVYYYEWDDLSGYLVNLYPKQTKWGPKLCIELHKKRIDGSIEKNQISMDLLSSQAISFFQRVENIINNKKLIVIAEGKKFINDDGDEILYTNLNLAQEEHDKYYVPWKYTSNNRNGMPDNVKIRNRKTGKQETDYTNRFLFFAPIINRNVLPKIASFSKGDLSEFTRFPETEQQLNAFLDGNEQAQNNYQNRHQAAPQNNQYSNAPAAQALMQSGKNDFESTQTPQGAKPNQAVAANPYPPAQQQTKSDDPFAGNEWNTPQQPPVQQAPMPSADDDLPF